MNILDRIGLTLIILSSIGYGTDKGNTLVTLIYAFGLIIGIGIFLRNWKEAGK